MKDPIISPPSRSLSLVRYMGAETSSKHEEAHITSDKLIGASSTAKMHTKDSNQPERMKAEASEEAQAHQAAPEQATALSQTSVLCEAGTLPLPALPPCSSLTERRAQQCGR